METHGEAPAPIGATEWHYRLSMNVKTKQTSIVVASIDEGCGKEGECKYNHC